MCRTGNFDAGYNSFVSFIYTFKYILEFKGLYNIYLEYFKLKINKK